MSETVECQYIDGNGNKFDFSDAVVESYITQGKNQPYMSIELTISRYLWDSSTFWSTQYSGDDDTLKTLYSTAPQLNSGNTILHVKTYGGEQDVLLTQTNTNSSKDYYYFTCYTQLYQLKKQTLNIPKPYVHRLANGVREGIPITWNGNKDSIATGLFTVTTPMGSYTFHPDTWSRGRMKSGRPLEDGIECITSPTTYTSWESLFNEPKGIYLKSDKIGTLRVIVPIYRDTSLPETSNAKCFDYSSNIARFDDFGGTLSADTVYAVLNFSFDYPYTTAYYERLIKQAHQSIVHTHHSTSVDNVDSSGELYTTDNDTTGYGVLAYTGIEYIVGWSQALISYAFNTLGVTSDQLIIEPAMMALGLTDIRNNPTQDLATLASIDDKSKWQNNETLCAFTPNNQTVSELVDQWATASNRYVYCTDKIYISSFNQTKNGVSVEDVTLGYDADETNYSSHYYTTGAEKVLPISLTSSVDYDEQDTNNLISKQYVRGANPSSYIQLTVSDSTVEREGTPITLPLPTTATANFPELNQYAYNLLLRNYASKPMLGITVAENETVSKFTYSAYLVQSDYDDTTLLPKSPIVGRTYIKTASTDYHLYKYVYDTESETGSWETITPNTDETCVIYSGVNTYYYIFNGTNWEVMTSGVTVTRNAYFAPNAVIKVLNDKRKDKTYTNIPLACTVIAYPALTTTYVFGDSMFQDTQQAISDLQEVASSAVTTSNVASTLSSDNVSSFTLSLGNVSLAEAGDDMTGYSGIVMRKSETTGQSSIDGYTDGKRQARFSSTGEITSGTVTYESTRLDASNPETIEAGDAVIMNRDGFKTRSWHAYSATEDPEAYAIADGEWQDEVIIGTDGKITAGNSSVTIGYDGLITYDSSGNPICYVDTEGNIKGVKITAEQITTPVANIGLATISSANISSLSAGDIASGFIGVGDRATYKELNSDGTYTNQYVYGGTSTSNDVNINQAINGGSISDYEKRGQYVYSVMLDNTGMKTYDVNQLKDIENQRVGVYNINDMVAQTSIGTDGKITAGAGAVKLDAKGLTTYDTDGVEQCYVTTDGAFKTGNYSLTNEGIKYKDNIIISDDGLSGAHVNADLITADSIKANLISVTALQADSVVADKIKASAVTTDKLNAKAVTTEKLDAGAVTADKISTTLLSADKILAEDITVTNASIDTIEANKIRSGKIYAGQVITLENEGSKLIAGSEANPSVVLDASGLTSTTYDSTKTNIVHQTILDSTGLLAQSAVGSLKIDGTGINFYKGFYNSGSSGSPTAKLTSEGLIQGIYYNYSLNDEGERVYDGFIGEKAITDDAIDTLTVSKLTAGSIKAIGDIATAQGAIRAGLMGEDSNKNQLFSVVMDYLGLHTYAYNSTTNDAELQCEIGTDGSIIAGGGRVKLNADGFSTYDSNGWKVAYVDSNTGYIYGSKVQANDILAGSITGSQFTIAGAGSIEDDSHRIKIDSRGFHTYNEEGTEVCTVDSEGNIKGISITADQITTPVANIGTAVISSANIASLVAGEMASGVIYAGKRATYKDSSGNVQYVYGGTNKNYVDIYTAQGLEKPEKADLGQYVYSVMINEDGLSTYNADEYANTESASLMTISNMTKQCYIGTDGSICAGGEFKISEDEALPRLTINENGLTMHALVDLGTTQYKYEPVSLSQNGLIFRGSSNVNLYSPYDIISISQNGLYTYNNEGTVQCCINTEGSIVTGDGSNTYGYMKLESDGLKIFTKTSTNLTAGNMFLPIYYRDYYMPMFYTNTYNTTIYFSNSIPTIPSSLSPTTEFAAYTGAPQNANTQYHQGVCSVNIFGGGAWAEICGTYNHNTATTTSSSINQVTILFPWSYTTWMMRASYLEGGENIYATATPTLYKANGDKSNTNVVMNLEYFIGSQVGNTAGVNYNFMQVLSFPSLRGQGGYLRGFVFKLSSSNDLRAFSYHFIVRNVEFVNCTTLVGITDWRNL